MEDIYFHSLAFLMFTFIHKWGWGRGGGMLGGKCLYNAQKQKVSRLNN